MNSPSEGESRDNEEYDRKSFNLLSARQSPRPIPRVPLGGSSDVPGRTVVGDWRCFAEAPRSNRFGCEALLDQVGRRAAVNSSSSVGVTAADLARISAPIGEILTRPEPSFSAILSRPDLIGTRSVIRADV